MTNWDAGTIEVRGQQMKVQVTDSGTWVADFAGKEWGAPTKDELRAVLMRATAKQAKRVSVLFDRLSYNLGGRVPQIRRYKAVGIHQGNGNLLIQEEIAGEFGGAEQDTSRYSTTNLKPLDSTQRTTYLNRLAAQRVANDAVAQFEKDHGLKLREAVEAALEEAVKDASA